MTRLLIAAFVASVVSVFAGVAVVARGLERGTAGQPSPSSFPEWAYPWDPGYRAPAADTALRRVPGSAVAYSLAQARDLFLAPDWHPDDHPTMPHVVARGRRPDVYACGSCHRAEGTGGPENASLAGLPAAYIVQQMADYKSGVRRFAGPQRPPSVAMVAVAKAVTDADVQAAALYFSALTPKANIQVVEADQVPKTYIAEHFRAITPGGAREPIGERIIEVPLDVEQFELRDSRSQFVAYVPRGSVEKGKTLARTGGATVACAGCHGPDLRGMGAVPSIAGRSPSYVARQLYDVQAGARASALSQQMRPAVQHLTAGDILSLAAYLASLAP